ncbi:Periplasmic binding protein [uncultured Paludibacter sp.]|uniref:Periplasmic binding protein n=1 Tax=uncultured Paludibacter sp. TaxID=497635 RepID=A0A653AK81_9BACT|nr:Periplasmic binding protein [uncultured Paludibacter sp.]
MKKIILIIISILLFVSCVPKQSNQEKKQENNKVILTHAKGFSIKNFDNYKEITVFSPWKKGEVYAKYYLVHDNNTKTPSDGVKIQVPIKNLGSSSVTHLSFLDLLDEINTVNGFCKPSLAYNAHFQENVKAGKVTDLGEEFTLNVEKTLALKPDVLMISGYNQTDANVQRIQQAGVPVVYNVEWMETSVLGRAEWIKFIAAFFDKEQQADSIFTDVEKKYNDLKNKALQAKTKPKILSGSNFRGTWYMPSGKNFMGQLYKDAGTDYFYANDTTGGSLPLNIETVLKNFSDAPIWLNCNYKSISDLIDSDGKHALFQAVKKKQVYNFNKRMLPSTANDFWESSVARPHLLLADVIAILHPEILPNYQLYFAEKLK